jgi:protein gp37
MSDLFHPLVPDAYIQDVGRVMSAADWHIYQVLTKRPERMCHALTIGITTTGGSVNMAGPQLAAVGRSASSPPSNFKT